MSEDIFVEGLTKTYNGKIVVDHLSLSVPGGTVFGLLGANGAGKSTTIECMLGTKQADSGTIRLLGQDPRKHRRTLFERIGVQFQEGDYQKEIKVSELCEETASLYRKPADWHKLCDQLGIGDKAEAAVGRHFDPSLCHPLLQQDRFEFPVPDEGIKKRHHQFRHQTGGEGGGLIHVRTAQNTAVHMDFCRAASSPTKEPPREQP